MIATDDDIMDVVWDRYCEEYDHRINEIVESVEKKAGDYLRVFCDFLLSHKASDLDCSISEIKQMFGEYFAKCNDEIGDYLIDQTFDYLNNIYEGIDDKIYSEVYHKTKEEMDVDRS